MTVYDTLIHLKTAVGEIKDVLPLDCPPFRGLLVVWHGIGFVLTEPVNDREWEWSATPYKWPGQ